MSSSHLNPCFHLHHFPPHFTSATFLEEMRIITIYALTIWYLSFFWHHRAHSQFIQDCFDCHVCLPLLCHVFSAFSFQRYSFFLFHLIIFCHLCLSYLHYGTTSLYLQFPMYQPFISSDQYPIAQTIKITNYIFFLLLYDIYSGYFERDIVMRKECVVSCLR